MSFGNIFVPVHENKYKTLGFHWRSNAPESLLQKRKRECAFRASRGLFGQSFCKFQILSTNIMVAVTRATVVNIVCDKSHAGFFFGIDFVHNLFFISPDYIEIKGNLAV